MLTTCGCSSAMSAPHISHDSPGGAGFERGGAKPGCGCAPVGATKRRSPAGTTITPPPAAGDADPGHVVEQRQRIEVAAGPVDGASGEPHVVSARRSSRRSAPSRRSGRAGERGCAGRAAVDVGVVGVLEPGMPRRDCPPSWTDVTSSLARQLRGRRVPPARGASPPVRRRIGSPRRSAAAGEVSDLTVDLDAGELRRGRQHRLLDRQAHRDGRRGQPWQLPSTAAAGRPRPSSTPRKATPPACEPR